MHQHSLSKESFVELPTVTGTISSEAGHHLTKWTSGPKKFLSWGSRRFSTACINHRQLSYNEVEPAEERQSPKECVSNLGIGSSSASSHSVFYEFYLSKQFTMLLDYFFPPRALFFPFWRKSLHQFRLKVVKVTKYGKNYKMSAGNAQPRCLSVNFQRFCPKLHLRKQLLVSQSNFSLPTTSFGLLCDGPQTCVKKSHDDLAISGSTIKVSASRKRVVFTSCHNEHALKFFEDWHTLTSSHGPSVTWDHCWFDRSLNTWQIQKCLLSMCPMLIRKKLFLHDVIHTNFWRFLRHAACKLSHVNSDQIITHQASLIQAAVLYQIKFREVLIWLSFYNDVSIPNYFEKESSKCS